jgi:uncharacterized glyoxalase superfamily protein PhnB
MHGKSCAFPGGRIGHAELEIGDSRIMLARQPREEVPDRAGPRQARRP